MLDVVEVRRGSVPVYRAPSGAITAITGKHADSWPHPRWIEVDGALFVEVPIPGETGWGLTFHAVRPRRTPLGTFLAQYVEGRSSAFPWWPVVVFSARAAWDHALGLWDQLTRKDA